jgi:ABC-type lipoprotein export system ATPase subunit
VRIRNISITGLFGVFDHEIPLFEREPITIIHGPNGVGKTSILKLLHGALNSLTSVLKSVPFDRLGITFDDGSILTVEPIVEDVPEVGPPGQRASLRKRRTVVYRLVRGERLEQEHIMPAGKALPLRSSRIEHYLPMISRVGPDEWSDSSTGRVYTFPEIVRIYGAHLPEEFRAFDVPTWLRDLQQQIPIHFIETQRLLVKKTSSDTTGQDPTVQQCATELATLLNATLAESASVSQALERSFPQRLISGAGASEMNEQEIRSKLAALDKKRSRLVESGLLDRSNEPTLPTKTLDETTRRVLAVYIVDTEKKLAVFDDLLSRIELIRSIVDSRFLQKTISINRSAGFVATTRDGRPLDLSGLSSGEQHELVLLFELLFRAKPGTLILIDEPELSLHIAWQQQFLRDLLKITKLAGLTALVATHSPQIIHDRWDMTVELLGPAR